MGDGTMTNDHAREATTRAATTPEGAIALLEAFLASGGKDASGNTDASGNEGGSEDAFDETLRALASPAHERTVSRMRACGHPLGKPERALTLLHRRGLLTDEEFRRYVDRIARKLHPPRAAKSTMAKSTAAGSTTANARSASL